MSDELQTAYDHGCVAGYEAGKAYGYAKGREDAARAITEELTKGDYQTLDEVTELLRLTRAARGEETT